MTDAWVLQRNDFPHAVYFDQDAAIAERDHQREKDRKWRKENAHVADGMTFIKLTFLTLTRQTMTNSASLFNPAWGSPVEQERRRRINLTLWAYAYEIQASPLVSDAMFDTVARQSRVTLRTGRFDAWWRDNFTPASGMWIHDHPALSDVAATYERFIKINA